ncbi:MAG: UDP-3-O-(3-hydroxymyristoyl)glucosamine N-acyltransferase [Planctomycetes bacterium]|nr:UDP-3-O-(3-hydroxymyristoyl)glucosamine N-acyltransferase [Planctomycetota bacterium]
MEFTVSQIAKKVQGELLGPSLTIITGVASLTGAREGDIAFVKDDAFVKAARSTRASALIAHRKIEKYDGPQIICENPHLAFVTMVNLFLAEKARPGPGVHKTAVIAKTAVIGKNVAIGAHVVVGEHSVIGSNSVIHPNVTIGDHVKIASGALLYPGVVIREGTRIGHRVIIHSNSVIGDDGFGYIQHHGKHVKIPQAGTVKICDDVEIGTCVTIDRAALDVTVIGSGVKIDNHSHIAHNVEIGENSLLIAFAKIAGGAKIGKNVIIAEDVGVTDNITIGDGCLIGGGSKVYKSVKAGEVVWGSPAKPMQLEKQIQATLKKLPKMRETLRRLTKKQGPAE